MNRLIFQLVLQLTELTCRGAGRLVTKLVCQLPIVASTEDQGGGRERGRERGKPAHILLWLWVLPKAKMPVG